VTVSERALSSGWSPSSAGISQRRTLYDGESDLGPSLVAPGPWPVGSRGSMTETNGCDRMPITPSG
jgi:hypothetical protein